MGYTNNAEGLIEKLTATYEPYFNVTNDAASGTFNWKDSSFSYTEGVTRTESEHNPNGLSLKWTANGWSNAVLNLKNPVALTDEKAAYVGVISFDEVTSAMPTFKFGLKGDCSGYTFSVVSISNTDGSVAVTRDVTSIIFKANSTNYVIIDPYSKGKTIPTNTTFCMNYTHGVYTAYLDALGYTNNAEGLIASLQAGELVAGATIDKEEIVIPEGNTVTVNGVALSGLDKTVSYYGSNPNIIDIDKSTGTVTTTGIGTAYASATIDGTGKTAACKITVKAVELGDVNYDGEIDIRDLVRAKKVIVGITGDYSVKATDIVIDEKFDALDLSALRGILLNASSKKKSDIGFGYFGANLSTNNAYADTQEMLENGVANTFFASDSYSLSQLNKNGGGAWVDVYSIYSKAVSAKTEDEIAQWKADFDAKVANLKATGYWEAVNGWYLDEPTNHNAVLAISEYAVKYGKRFFVCYMAGSVAPNNTTINHPNSDHYVADGITEETTKYLTDIAYDLYWNPAQNVSLYEDINAEMHSRLGNNKPKIWHVTFTALSASALTNTPEANKALCDSMIANLNTMYNFLKEEENKGGLLCYSYDKPSYPGQYGLFQINEMTNGAFDALLERANEIGREICSGILES